MAFFHFSQNNSGDSFDLKKDIGIAHHVIIEADNYEQANGIMANLIDHDWDGGHGGYCPCCGSRWYELHSSDSGDDSPMVYDTSASEHKDTFAGNGDAVAVHYKDGLIKWY